MNAFIRDGAPRRRKRRAEKKVDRCHAKKKKKTSETDDDGGRPPSLPPPSSSPSSDRGENAELIVRLPVRHINSVLRERIRNRQVHDDQFRHDDAAASAATTSSNVDDSDDVVLVETTWPMIDLTAAEDGDGVAGESSADQQPPVAAVSVFLLVSRTTAGSTLPVFRHYFDYVVAMFARSLERNAFESRS